MIDPQTVPLVGFRKLDPVLLINNDPGNPKKPVFGLPTDVLLKAARASKPVQNVLESGGKNAATASLEDVFAAARKVAASSQWSSVGSTEPIAYELPGMKTPAYADPNFIIGLTTSELFGGKSRGALEIIDIGSGQDKIAAIQLDPFTASSFKGAYEYIVSDSSSEYSPWGSGIGACAANLTQTPLVSRNARFQMGEISFGKPRVFTAASKRITPADADSEPDPIYWLDFYVTLRDLTAGDLEDMTIRVRISPTESLALALLPNFQTKLGFVEDPACGLTKALEEFVSTQSRYKNLKPNIVAGGLRECDAYWKMSSGAIGQPLYIFTAIVRVPAECETVDVVMSAEGKLRKHFLVQKDVVATDQAITMRIPLHTRKP